MITKRWIIISFPILLVLGVYFLGSKPDHPDFNLKLPSIPEEADALENYIIKKERRYKLKPDNESRIIWNDSTRKKTEFALVYMHGFSASQKEGDPVHRRFARSFGCNLYLPRLVDHGIDTSENLLTFTADRAWESAKEALAIGQKLGEKVIIMSTSSGSTLSLMLAAQYPQQVHSLINLSPNIAINNPAAFLLNDPWGLYIARLVKGGKYNSIAATSNVKSAYWYEKYRLESVVQLQELIESSMNDDTFHAINQPSLTLYYYKNEQEQDPEVKVSAMQKMHQKLGTPDALKVIKSMPKAGAHVLGSHLTSKDIEGVYGEIEHFATNQLGLVKRQ